MNIRSLVLALLLPGMLVGCSGQKDITPTDQPGSANAELELISAVDAYVELFQWISNPDISIGFTLDGLSGIMLILVTGLSFVIQLFSTSYMEKDENHCNYFVYFNFFVFSMLLLVMSSNFLVMFFGWELVGLSSYLLISFWSKKQLLQRPVIKHLL